MDVNTSSEFQKALQFEQQGDLPSAKKCYETLLTIHPTHEQSLHGLALIFAQMGDIKTAKEHFEKIISLNPQSDSAHSNLGNCYTQLGDLVTAKKCFDRAIEINPQLADAHFNLGNTLCKLNQFPESIECYAKAISLNPQFAEGYFNMANSLVVVGRYTDALTCYQKIESLYGNNPIFCLNIGCTYFGVRKFTLAIDWISRAVQLKDFYPEAYNELGRLYSSIGKDRQALEFYLKANTQAPTDQTYIHNIVVANMRLDDFLSAYHYALKLDFSLKRSALVHYLISILCEWTNYKELSESILNSKGFDVSVTSWDLLRISDSAKLQYEFTKNLVHKNFPKSLALGLDFKQTPGRKIKIGYFSPDFRNHAVMHLAAEIFLTHDRNLFEVHAFSMHPGHTLEEKNNLKNYFDYLYEINELSDLQVTEMVRGLGIDIAVDLTGNTRDLRTGIFALRAAPVQVNYLGYTGTMGAEYYDYIIADPVVIPPEHQAFYTEKLVYLNSFMPRQLKLSPSPKIINRAMYGLPPEGFVFCCFNKSFKFNPEVFDSWLNILKSVPLSVLWFNGLSSEAAKNLKNFATERQIDPLRLVFSAPIVDISDHLARHQLAGLFLDTYPYNAHTTASDALWSGLPVITRMGNSFASRVAASLLTAIDLPQLITHSIKDYESLAISLAHNPKRLSELKSELKNNIKTKRLFDMKRYMREYEAALIQMHQRTVNHQVPAVIDVIPISS
jgi:predicted O-linked N-acetylglucosamine transferase (SPINDLY family)